MKSDGASDNSSVCANSELSNISDESLPSDAEDVDVDDEDEGKSGILISRGEIPFIKDQILRTSDMFLGRLRLPAGRPIGVMCESLLTSLWKRKTSAPTRT